MNAEMSQVAPSLSAFSRNIELRVNAGVQSVTACIEKAESKGRMLKHVRDLVLHVTGRLPSGPRSHPFESPLEKIFFLEERPSLTTELLEQQDDGPPRETLLAPTSQLNRTLESTPTHSFVKLITSECGLDPSRTFVVILVQLEVLCQPKSSQKTNTDKTGVHLNIRFDESVPAVWELTALEGLNEGDTFWFGARSAVMAMLMAPSLGDLRLSVSANTEDGRSQHLGAFTMSSILSRIVDINRATRVSTGHYFPFLRHVSFVAEGRGAQSLHRYTRMSGSAASRTSSLKTRENLALLSITVDCGTALAMAVAQLKTYTDDDVEIRGTTQIEPSSLTWLDDSLLSLEAEAHAIRELAARPDVFGCTLADIRQIMELQLVADESFGMMEENYLGSWS